MTPRDPFPEPGCKHFSPDSDKDAFTGRMRFHQSWYRHHILEKDPGPNPSAGGATYGNWLEESDGKTGLNFLSSDIFEHVKQRFPSANRGKTGLSRNLLESQAMSFNLFGPLKTDVALATQLLRSLPKVSPDAEVTDIVFDFAPDKKIHLNDGTHFDAFVEYVRASGARGFVGIETKLSEPFSRESYPFEARYSTWMTRGDWWWQPGAESDFPDETFNQLWRNHLLVYSMLHQDMPKYSEGLGVIVFPLGNEGASEAICDYRKRLLPGGKATLVEWPLEKVADKWAVELEGDPRSEWFARFKTRYLDLEASQAAWQEFQRSGR